jgi:hypothetical protein
MSHHHHVVFEPADLSVVCILELFDELLHNLYRLNMIIKINVIDKHYSLWGEYLVVN